VPSKKASQGAKLQIRSVIGYSLGPGHQPGAAGLASGR
jgi:hypothetical protein